MKLLNRFGLLLFFTGLLTSCGSSGPSIKKDIEKLKSANTYAYLPNKDTILSRNYENASVNETIIATINANMKEQGYRLDKIQPDVLVYVHPMFDEKIAVNANPVYTNYAYYRPGFYLGDYYKDYMYDNYFTVQRIDGPRVKQVPYTERTIVIDLIDRRTNQILWRGTSDEEIKTRRMDREIRDYIDDIFKDL